MIIQGPAIVKSEKEESDNPEESQSPQNSSEKSGRKAKKNKKKPKHNDEDDDDDDVQHIESTLVLSNVTSTPAEPAEDDKKDIIKIEEDTNPFYDPFSMNPLRSGAVKAPPAELATLYSHFHPSVALFSSKMIEGKAIEYSGDPLEDLTLIRFLDRYVFKNPKKLDDKKVSKANDPLAVRARYAPRGLRSLAVDSQAYLNEKEERIPVDELFLYRYLKRRNEMRGVKEEKEEEDDDNDSVNSEEFNEMMDELGGEKDFEELDIAGEIGAQVKKGRICVLV